MINIRQLSSDTADFRSRLADLTKYEEEHDQQIDSAVAGILMGVKTRGDVAVLEIGRAHV